MAPDFPLLLPEPEFEPELDPEPEFDPLPPNELKPVEVLVAALVADVEVEVTLTRVGF